MNARATAFMLAACTTPAGSDWDAGQLRYALRRVVQIRKHLSPLERFQAPT